MKKYYVYLKCNFEKTGDYIESDTRLESAKHFADKKQIPLKDWLSIYTVCDIDDLEINKIYNFKCCTYKFNGKHFKLLTTNNDTYRKNILMSKFKSFIEYIN